MKHYKIVLDGDHYVLLTGDFVTGDTKKVADKQGDFHFDAREKMFEHFDQFSAEQKATLMKTGELSV